MGTEIECLKIAEELRKSGYKVEIEMTPYDLSKGRIAFRHKA